jgi:hypothetical protein
MLQALIAANALAFSVACLSVNHHVELPLALLLHLLGSKYQYTLL